jgi:regulation of enolase protein 1 (concanavalin A-like superfamily)
VPTSRAAPATLSRVWDAVPGEAQWLNRPVDARVTDAGLLVTAAEGSSLWRETSYGFTHDSGHGLLAPFADGTALEVSFLLDFGEQFDQAGVLVRADERTWTKAGVEVSDGLPQLGAVVTRGLSDWSVAPVPEWAGREVTVRASRSGNALTVRARADDDPWRLVRVAPLDPGADLVAGPFCCAPTRAELTVRFTRIVSTTADASLHPE